MSFSARILVALAAVSCAALASTTSTDLRVIVYAGPTKCSNKDKDKPNKIESGHVVGLHFVVTIDETSAGRDDVIGRKIESSRDGMGVAPSFPVGQGKVIAGLDRGLIGLCRGSSAHIIVPPRLAYGRMGKPEQGVGPDTILRYDVEIIDIRPPAPNDFAKIDTNEDWEISIDEAREYFEGLGQVVDLDSLWNDEDADGDGYISWDEFKGSKGSEGPPPKRKKTGPQQGEQRHQEQETVDTLIRRIDSDEDGRISKAELAYIFEEMGGELTEDFWDESDPDGDGFITFEEFAGSGKVSESERGEEL
jgi:Ca2+-binding EF-hand superfamily protein